MKTKGIMILASVVMLCTAVVATILFLGNGKPVQGMIVGDNIASNRINVFVLDRQLPQQGGSFTHRISTRDGDGLINVTVTVTSLDAGTRSATFSVTVPSGYRFIHSMHDNSGLSFEIGESDITMMRNRIVDQNFTNQISMSNLSEASWTSLMNGFVPFQLFVAPTGNIDNISFDENGGNAVTFAGPLQLLHPNALPLPTHPQGWTFLHWSIDEPNVETPARWNDFYDGMNLYAVWLETPRSREKIP